MARKKIRLQIAVWAVFLMMSALCPSARAADKTPDTGYLVTSDLWIRAVINTDEKGPVEAVWQEGGNDVFAEGHKVVWGYFYASPSDVSWGSKDNPDVFVKIWFDAGGRLDVSFFHVSVPNIDVYSDYKYDGTPDVHGVITTSRRYIRQWYENGKSGMEENNEDGIAAAGYSPIGNPSGYSAINTLKIAAIINTVDGHVEAGWRKGGKATTDGGHEVFWGYFYALPSDVSWGSENNPDLFVKVWFDASGRVDVNFFHVSVPDIEVYSDLPDKGDYAQKGTTILTDRYIRHEYTYQSEESEITRPEGWSDGSHGNKADPNYEAVFSEGKVRRIELIIDSADWQAMTEDMTDIYGEFGKGNNQSLDDNLIFFDATEACVGKSEGDACEMTMRDQAVSGICAADGENLVCRQNQPSDNMSGTAEEACVGKKEGDACEMTFQNQTVSGLCTLNREQLSCRTENPGGNLPPDNNFSSDACVGKSEGDACETTMREQTVTGSCVTEGENLVCRTDNAGGLIPGNADPGGAGIDMSGGRNPIWKPCTLKFEDKVWYHVGVRFKGNSSLTSTWGSGIWKLPMRLEFDQFEDDYPEIDNQRFYGFKKLSLSSNYGDDSFLREKVAADIFRDAGVPSARTAFYRVYVDHGAGLEYFGLYTMVEIPADPLLENYFQNSDGNLYKPEGTGATFASYDEASFDKETNEDEADWSDVKALFDALHSSRDDAAAWRASLEKILNVEGFLRWLAVNTLIQNWDTYGRMSHNYYLYNNSEDGRLNWIPWDNNFSLMSGMGGGGGGDRGAISLSLSEATETWPLIRYLADDPIYWAKYVSFVKETAEGVFDPERMKAIYKAAHDLIRPYTVGDEGEKEGYTFLKNAEDFDTALEYLNTHVDSRRNDALQFLMTNP